MRVRNSKLYFTSWLLRRSAINNSPGLFMTRAWDYNIAQNSSKVSGETSCFLMAFVLVEEAARLPTSLSIAGGSTFASSSKSYSLRPVLFNYLQSDRPLLLYTSLMTVNFPSICRGVIMLRITLYSAVLSRYIASWKHEWCPPCVVCFCSPQRGKQMMMLLFAR